MIFSYSQLMHDGELLVNSVVCIAMNILAVAGQSWSVILKLFPYATAESKILNQYSN